MPQINIRIKKLHPDAVIPQYKKSGDAGFDLHCLKDTLVPANGLAVLPTGLCMAIPEGYEMQIRMRSGASMQTPLMLANAPGTIDSGYRGEIGIIVRNLNAQAYLARKGERIAQGVIAPVLQANFMEADSLPDSERGGCGFGSTGKD